jgi:hypothetical protein
LNYLVFVFWFVYLWLSLLSSLQSLREVMADSRDPSFRFACQGALFQISQFGKGGTNKVCPDQPPKIQLWTNLNVVVFVLDFFFQATMARKASLDRRRAEIKDPESSGAPLHVAVAHATYELFFCL